MYSPYSESSKDVNEFLNDNKIYLAQFKIKDNLHKIEKSLLDISSDIEFFESVVISIFKESVSRGWLEMADLCERMGVWEFPSVSGNPYWTEYFFERAILENNDVPQKSHDAIMRASSSTPKERTLSLIYLISKMYKMDEDERISRVGNALKMFSILCKQKDIDKDLVINTAADAIMMNSEIHSNSSRNLIRILDCLDVNFDGRLSENNIYMFDTHTDYVNDLTERSLYKIIMEMDFSAVTSATRKCIDIAIHYHPEKFSSIVLKKLETMSQEEIINNSSINLLKLSFYINSDIDPEYLDRYRSLLSKLSDNPGFDHYFESNMSYISLIGTPLSIVFIDEMAKSGRRFFIDNKDFDYRLECESFLLNIKRIDGINIDPFVDILMQTNICWDVIRSYDKASKSNPEIYTQYESRLKNLKVASCNMIKERAEMEVKKNINYKDYPLYSEFIKYNKSNISLSLFNVISLSLSDEEKLDAVSENKHFIKYMIKNGHMSNKYSSKLSAKDKRDLITTDLGM